MRKIFSILFLSSWLLFQYSILLNYRECQLAPLSSTAAVQCDCQQQVAENPGNNGQPAAERSISKQRPEEVIAGSNPLTLTRYPDDPSPARLIDFGHALLNGHPPLVFQPPRV